ncbi:hypothetical protein HID58_067007 [Brassica napus]|uniref:BnaCnng48690D protein n=2 Tax=Brassica napus TaxID=3708 RepID=A0A078JGI4_BRANA|nr:hypothetical protein HID58_067007 [Brassica napus]CAF1930342.1 unnamed protein product [Brassica napus]CDY65789.1 BnaCnng48690D [Brassica napus]
MVASVWTVMDVPLHHSSAVAPDLGSRQIGWRADGVDMQSTSVLFPEAGPTYQEIVNILLGDGSMRHPLQEHLQVVLSTRNLRHQSLHLKNR